MSTLGTWDKIIGSLGSTTTEFGGDWGNLISDLFNGIDIGLSDPTKKPIINTEFGFKPGKLKLFDFDASHHINISADDIDTGDNRNIRIRRMNEPFIEDFLVLEGMPQDLLNKDIDVDLNNVTNIENDNIKVGAGITDNKLAQITDKAKLHSALVYTDQANTYSTSQLQTFRQGQVSIFDSDNSHKYTLTTDNLASDFNINIPSVTANDTFALLGLSNIFTNYMTLRKDAIDILHIYRPANTGGNKHGIYFDAWDSAGASKTYNALLSTISVNTAGSENSLLEFQTRSSGTLATRMALNSSGALYIGSNLRLVLTQTGLSAERIFAFPDVAGKLTTETSGNTFTAMQTFGPSLISLLDSDSSHKYTLVTGNLSADRTLSIPTMSANDTFAFLGLGNVFTANQKVQISGSSAYTLYRTDNTVSNGVGVIFNLNNSTSSETAYAAIYGTISDNTASAEHGIISFQVKKSGTLGQYMVLDGNQLSLGLSGLRAVLDSTGISGSSKIFTFPNLAGQLQTINATQTVSNKSQSARDAGNTFDYVRKYQALEAVGSVQFRSYDIIGEGHFKDIQYYGSIISSDNDSSGYWVRLQSPSVSGGFAGLAHFSNVQTSFRRAFNGWVIGKYQLFSSDFPLSSQRFIFGFSDQQTLPPDSDTLLASGHNGFFVAFRSGTDTNYRILHNDATGTMVDVDSTVVFPTSSTIHEIEIKMDTSTGITWIIRNSGGTIQGQGTINTRIPATTTKLYFYYGVIGNAKSILLRNAECKTGGH